MHNLTSRSILFGSKLIKQRRSYYKPLNYVERLSPVDPSKMSSIPTYRVLDNDGNVLIKEEEPKIEENVLIKMYTTMIKLSALDSIMYDAQRQGRVSFYMTNHGEEGTHVGAAAALDPSDVLYGQYREAGVLMYRGFTIANCVNQCFGNRLDASKSRMMPVHYGSALHNLQTISSPLATQLPQSVGAAYALKMAKKKLVAVSFFGDGSASEGDCHAAMNIAATTESPTIFFCRNNGYAISTPTTEQYRGDGIVGHVAARGQGYGIVSFRVDGNDPLAVYNTVKSAREICLAEGNNRPALIESITYRVGHHSTSDDSSAYRTEEEIKEWNSTNNPISRFRAYLRNKKIWTEAQNDQLVKDSREEVIEALLNAEKEKKPKALQMFEDVYEEMPWNIKEQMAELETLIKDYPQAYPLSEYESS